MKTAAFIIGLVLICCKFTERTIAEGQLKGFVETVQSECRDRYLWIQVASTQTPRFEAVDGNGVHSISEQLASHCGYTISTFKMNGFTTFRASYYSCFTHNQNDEVFTFRFNVMVINGDNGWISQPVSAVCSGLIWTNREITCEEDYMEVNVNRESSCGGQWREGGHVWQAAYPQAQRTASSVWQLMFLQSDGQASTLSISQAQAQGYSLTTTAQRVVLRSKYKQLHAKVIVVDGVPVEVNRVFLFFKKMLLLVVIDMSMACTVNSGSFDGEWLLWDIPWVMTPLVEEAAKFESQSLSMGVDGVLLDEPNATTRGFRLVRQERVVQIRVPFGAEGGFRKSLVVNNMYKEMYVIFVLYEHVFSLLYTDGSSIDTRHRMLRVLDTPLHCYPPFSLDQTMSDDQAFSVYLGNIPNDVILEDIWVNRKRLLMAKSVERGISSFVHVNGSQAYKLRLPFEDDVVDWTYLGGGVVQYSIDINFTLTIMPQRDSYYHQTFITAQVFNAFPPEILAQCLDRGITFSVVRPPRAESIWEVGIDHEPLTSQLAVQRGYRLHNTTHKTTLEIPMFSTGYTYEGINLSNFYGTFSLLLRDSKTLDVQTSTSKRCLFKTEDMIVCSTDGTMTVVTTLTSTWPTVQPERTSLLDRTCGPKQTDGSRVLFEFKVDSCGTRAMVGELYVVYENEILHDRQLITDGPYFISRESQFKLTVRCFYPLGGVNRLSVNRIVKLETPGFGSVGVFESSTASANKVPAQDCSHPVSVNAINTPTNQVQQTHAAGGILLHPFIRPRPTPGPSRFITVPGRYNKLPSSPQGLQTFPIQNLSARPQSAVTPHVPQQVSSYPGHLKSQTDDQNLVNPFSSFPPSYGQLPDSSIQMSNINTPSFDFVDVRGEHSGPADDTSALVLDSLSRTPDSSVAEQLESSWGSSGQALTLESLNSLDDHVLHSGLMWDQSTIGQNGIVKLNQDLLRLKFNLSLGMQELNKQHEAKSPLSLQGSLGVGMEMAKKEERPVYQPQSLYNPFQTSQLYTILHPPAEYSSDQTSIMSRTPLLPSRDKKYVPIHESSRETLSVSNEPKSTATNQVDQNVERTGAVERRNIETVKSRVQTIRVKPLSKLMSSGHHLMQKPVAREAKTQISNPSQYNTGLTAVSNDWTSQQLQGHRGSNKRYGHLPEKTSFQTLKQEQGAHGVLGKLHESAGIPQTDLSLNPQGHQKKVIQLAAQTGNGWGQESASTLRDALQSTGESHIRIRPGPGFSGRIETHDPSRLQSLQNPNSITRERSSRTSDLSFTLPTTPETPVNIREYKSTDPNSRSYKGLNPTPGGAEIIGFNTRPYGSGGPGSDLKMYTRLKCGSQYGSSVHQGIVRGKQIS